MAPIRRYLRITKYSVLECRIYLDNPALAESWLLNSRNPILPRVIESVRPLVLPKLREENERSKKGGKKKGVKDVVVEEDFEVSIFLTEMSTRHSLLHKQKHFRNRDKKNMTSNSSKLTGWLTTGDQIHPIEVEDAPVFLREESGSEEMPNLLDLPSADEDPLGSGDPVSSDDDGLFVEQGARKRPRAGTRDSPLSASQSPPSKRQKEGQDDDKKKMAMETTYDGFSIYGRVLCLVVKRIDKKGKAPENPNHGGGQATMEQWITSTQMPIVED